VKSQEKLITTKSQAKGKLYLGGTLQIQGKYEINSTAKQLSVIFLLTKNRMMEACPLI